MENKPQQELDRLDDTNIFKEPWNQSNEVNCVIEREKKLN